MTLLAPAAEPATRTDVDRIQGVWMSVAGPRESRFLFVGNRFTFEFVGGDVYMGTFDLAPGHMDLHIQAGPAEHVNTYSYCIYLLEGGVLRWCPGRPGSERRPSGFPDVDDPRYLSLVFRRVPRSIPH